MAAEEIKMFVSNDELIKALRMYVESYGGKLADDIHLSPKFENKLKFAGVNIVLDGEKNGN